MHCRAHKLNEAGTELNGMKKPREAKLQESWFRAVLIWGILLITQYFLLMSQPHIFNIVVDGVDTVDWDITEIHLYLGWYIDRIVLRQIVLDKGIL